MTVPTIDIVSDAVCPWCYLGKRRLEAALERLGERDAVVRWRPYQLDDTIPPQGLDRKAYMRAKFPDAAQLSQIHARLAALGGEVGLAFDFDAIRRSPNTLDAHRLLRWAGERGAQNAVAERLFQAYFEQGLDIGDAATLAGLAGDCGLNADAVREKLAAGDDRAEVGAEIAHWRRAGVDGVPFFIFEGRLALAGAQSPETFAAALVEARHQASG
ncbi:MAG: DsbA family oxidoreductase [Roseiarcus sp.]